ncbi:MAG: hypothetical protein HN726_03275 [Candidatus Magasanikbacteria bacterium]|jgi:citryl-CoA synthetase large subunit|nr:hypothetical protein [Candidatus Magasanikbacteria bacterium]MBT4221196.1 hypothetical protein [Candidatus Magasanikbacteria bacterium]MBT4350038.1 hypothetical protein [Candidatus Magasanikbacteria bacterium]MBT4541984.1 hypothetical protein [Candidatus Magasanikbacteria bacterium]MBT6252739.1 hypothetical protein [Candidatus Magasanikbacteria bacterium]
MNLYEFEGKQLFLKHGISTPKGVVIHRGDDIKDLYLQLSCNKVVVKAQILSGKRGKHGGIVFCETVEEVEQACLDLFSSDICGQYVASIYIEEQLSIVEEHYISIVYDTNKKQPMIVYSDRGGVDIEDVDSKYIQRIPLDICDETISSSLPYAQELWACFKHEDTRVVEINPLVKTTQGEWVAADAKVAIDDDAFYRHDEWQALTPRTMMGRPATDREILVQEIDKGEKYYQGTAGKYIEMDGDIALILIGGGASIANMDALKNVGLTPANYTEYSGNPPLEKVYKLSKLVLSKPGIKGLWVCGAVSNFTNVRDTFQGLADALDEVKPTYPIVIRRAGPFDAEGFALMKACAKRNGLDMKLFGKDIPMGETAAVLAQMVSS